MAIFKKSQIARFMYNIDGVSLLGSRDEDSQRSEQQRCIGKRVLYLDVKGNNKSLHISAGLSHHMSSGRFCQTSTLSVPHSTAALPERPSYLSRNLCSGPANLLHKTHPDINNSGPQTAPSASHSLAAYPQRISLFTPYPDFGRHKLYPAI